MLLTVKEQPATEQVTKVQTSYYQVSLCTSVQSKDRNTPAQNVLAFPCTADLPSVSESGFTNLKLTKIELLLSHKLK